MEVQKQFDKVLCSRVHGLEEAKPIAEKLKMKSIIVGLQNVANEVTKEKEAINEKIKKDNVCIITSGGPMPGFYIQRRFNNRRGALPHLSFCGGSIHGGPGGAEWGRLGFGTFPPICFKFNLFPSWLYCYLMAAAIYSHGYARFRGLE